MENLHWELAVLGRAVHYKNLTGAAEHVGLSQPQLSRIVAKLEGELDVILLDRTARRQSGWTPIAFKIAETYARHSRKLAQSLQQLQSGGQITQISIGALEGLAALASDLGNHLFERTKVHLIELNVYDLSELEERFAKGELDLALTCREPGRSKRRFERTLGYQDVEQVDGAGVTHAFSPFEHAAAMSARKPDSGRTVISNSLAVRKSWIETYGASGSVPSPVRRRKGSSAAETPVHLIANEWTSQAFWGICAEFRI